MHGHNITSSLSHLCSHVKTCSYTLQRPLLLLSLCFQTDGGPGKGPNRHDLFHGWTAVPLQCGLWGWQGCCESTCLFIFISASMFAISVRLYLVVCLYSLSLEKPNAHSFCENWAGRPHTYITNIQT